MRCRVTIVDAYDSFVHILVDYVRRLGCDVRVLRKDEPGLVDAIDPSRCDVLLLGPGPGHPRDSGYLALLERNAGRVPVFGVCLGHQAIGLYYGATLAYAQRLMHGKTSRVEHDGKGCFRNVPRGFRAMRYHSIVVDAATLGNELVATATSDTDGYLMGLRHASLPIEGVQFHPESIGTEYGLEIIRNFIEVHARGGGATASLAA
ncbi:anthranilate synthase component II [Tahibacter soli]|uniref:Aminodeoxychorismate/anthranilate synthase component II n=1 Tax=Tahibacter soli TaxID=2983605 RepID=A0A9X3YMP9_9GAMM|nr:aminodeoxychorismate/anthranilate synthase component II [Tahibacter soli]MDC8015174.1 aminodeoxychorismate/anthranilate synthase component II [Tahibacter soli]